MCGLKAAQIHGRPCRATKEPVAVLYSLLPYGKKILICRHLSSMLSHDGAAAGASSSDHLKDLHCSSQTTTCMIRQYYIIVYAYIRIYVYLCIHQW